MVLKRNMLRYHINGTRFTSAILRNTKPQDVTDICPRIYSNVNDVLCPHRFLNLFKSLCAGMQERLLCNPLNKKMLNKFKSGEISYMYNEKLPVGPNSIGTLCKDIAKSLGFEDWDRCTGHG
jgi:hypothetical protein